MRRVAIKIMKQEEALCFHKTVKKSTGARQESWVSSNETRGMVFEEAWSAVSVPETTVLRGSPLSC